MVCLQAVLVATALSAPGDTVFLDFYADWCGPCRAMEPTINALIEQGCPVRKVNIDREPQLARQYGVGPVPCYVMLVDGQVVDRVVGGTTFSRLERMWRLAAARQQQERRQPPASGVTPMPLAPAPAGATRPLAQVLQPTAETRSATDRLGKWMSAPAWAPQRGVGASSVPQASRGQEATPIHGQDARAMVTDGDEARTTLDAALVAASVRLLVEDANGHSCGSGTIIDARQGEALILTCGHIFRDSQGKGRIEVDLFGPRGVEQVVGSLISYDLQRDVALVSIRTPGPVAAARVAPPGYQITPEKEVVSVGCNNGDRPTARHSRVNSLDKFLGPPNVQVDGLPVEGRSGGGLFSREGLVIGVCNAADPSDREGFYAALASIHAELDRARLSFVYRCDGAGIARQPATPPAAALAASDPPPLPKQMPRPAEAFTAGGRTLQPTAAAGGGDSGGQPSAAAPLRVEEQAALDEIRQRLQAGAEVICVVRSRDPKAQSEIFVLDQASPTFLGQLSALSRAGQEPLLSTSLEVPRDHKSAEGWRLESRPD